MTDSERREPWWVNETPHDDMADYEVRTHSDYIVAEVHNRQHADLIAAAPDLLEVLEDWERMPGNWRDAKWWHEWHRKKDAALAKAKGGQNE